MLPGILLQQQCTEYKFLQNTRYYYQENGLILTLAQDTFGQDQQTKPHKDSTSVSVQTTPLMCVTDKRIIRLSA